MERGPNVTRKNHAYPEVQVRNVSQLPKGLFDKSQSFVADIQRTLRKLRLEQRLEQTHPSQCDQAQGYSNKFFIVIARVRLVFSLRKARGRSLPETCIHTALNRIKSKDNPDRVTVSRAGRASLIQWTLAAG